MNVLPDDVSWFRTCYEVDVSSLYKQPPSKKQNFAEIWNVIEFLDPRLRRMITKTRTAWEQRKAQIERFVRRI